MEYIRVADSAMNIWVLQKVYSFLIKFATIRFWIVNSET